MYNIEFPLNRKCTVKRIDPKTDQNKFIGVEFFPGKENKDDHFEVKFPLGYHLDKGNEPETRKDILLLMHTLERGKKKDQHQTTMLKPEDEGGFPLQSYLFIISDYMAHGLYKEIETRFTCEKRGKIDWGRTIKTQRPYFQDNDAFYLNYLVRGSQPNEDNLITLIHEYCVYESFRFIGWLFTDYMPPKPRIEPKSEVSLSVIDDKLKTTFNDRIRELFFSMRDIIKVHSGAGEKGVSEFISIYKTKKFEDVWEEMINSLCGVPNVEDYYPQPTWTINGNSKADPFSNQKHALRPDTIMKCDNGYSCILDAKYHSCCVHLYDKNNDPFPIDYLPWASDINKQITYGEYIVNGTTKKYEGEQWKDAYNAFILPFDAKTDGCSEKVKYIGYARGNWKDNKMYYQTIQGIMLDMKYAMECFNGKGSKDKLKAQMTKIIKGHREAYQDIEKKGGNKNQFE